MLAVEPWFEPHTWVPGTVSMRTAEEGDVKVCRMMANELEGDRSALVSHHPVAGAGRVHHFVETHRLRLSSDVHLTRLFEQAGIRSEYLETAPGSRGLFVATLG